MTADMIFTPLAESVTSLAETDPLYADFYTASADGTYQLKPGAADAHRDAFHKVKGELDELAQKAREAERQTAAMKREIQEHAIHEAFDLALADLHMPRGLKEGLILLLRKELPVKAEILDTPSGLDVRVSCWNTPLTHRQIQSAMAAPQFAAYREYGGKKGPGQFTSELATIT